MSLPGGAAVAVGGSADEPDRGPSAAATIRGAGLAAALLVAWAGVVTAEQLGLAGGFAGAAANHLLFAGVACTAIATAVPKFVAVWSNVQLCSRRAALAAAPLVAGGTAGVAGGLLAGSTVVLVAGGAALSAGLWALAASTTRTLAAARPWDATERLLAAGTWSLALGSVLGLAVGAGRAGGPTAVAGVSTLDAVLAHVTLMVAGGVLAVGYGGAFQLSAMLTGAPDSTAATRVARAVSVGHPVGVSLLAGGRLFALGWVASVGGVAVGACAVGAGGVIGYRLVTGGESSAATRRYWGAAIGFPLWGVAAATRWATAPLSRPAVLGGHLAEAALWGAVAFLVVGSLYHIGPFLVWLERYADRLGLEPVPDVADLYDPRVERVDGVALAVAVVGLAVGGASIGAVGSTPGVVAATVVDVAGLVGAGAACVAAVGVAANLAIVVRDHAPWSPTALLGAGAVGR